jgi:hypothetical protein
MLPEATARPCNECPWRRNAARGYLGPFTAEEWLLLAHSDEAIACHLTIEEEGSWEGNTKQCRGAAICRANMAKTPRDPEVITGPKDRELVFGTPMEFREHHQREGRTV